MSLANEKPLVTSFKVTKGLFFVARATQLYRFASASVTAWPPSFAAAIVSR